MSSAFHIISFADSFVIQLDSDSSGTAQENFEVKNGAGATRWAITGGNNAAPGTLECTTGNTWDIQSRETVRFRTSTSGRAVSWRSGDSTIVASITGSDELDVSSGSLVLPTRASTTLPSFPGLFSLGTNVEGEVIFVDDGSGNTKIAAFLNGSWREETE